MRSPFKSVARHGGSYFGMQLIMKLAGLVSFPIITRLLTVHDYGLLSLANTTLLFLYAIGKCGVPKALISTIAEQATPMVGKLYLNGVLAVSGVTTLVCIFSYCVLYFADKFTQVPVLFYFLPPIVLFRNTFAVHLAWLQAAGKVGLQNVLTGCVEIGSNVVAVVALVCIAPTVTSLFSIKCAYEVIVIGIIVLFTMVSLRKSFVPFDCSMKGLLVFGFPLVWVEISAIMVAFGDRYQLGYLLDAEAVGLYSGAYNLALYAQQILAVPLSTAAYPIYNKLFVAEGPEETIGFLRELIRYYMLIAVPLMVFLSYNSRLILSILASEKYAETAVVVPIVLGGMLLNGTLPLASAGLYIYKKTKVLGKVSFLGALLNLVLNWAFISFFGYVGAAVATLVTFIVMFCWIKKESDKVLPVSISIVYFIKTISLSFIAFAPFIFYPVDSVVSLFLSGIVFVAIYLMLLFIFDRNIRMLCREFLRYR